VTSGSCCPRPQVWIRDSGLSSSLRNGGRCVRTNIVTSATLCVPGDGFVRPTAAITGMELEVTGARLERELPP
jgi:hypothetical protein